MPVLLCQILVFRGPRPTSSLRSDGYMYLCGSHRGRLLSGRDCRRSLCCVLACRRFRSSCAAVGANLRRTLRAPPPCPNYRAIVRRIYAPFYGGALIERRRLPRSHRSRHAAPHSSRPKQARPKGARPLYARATIKKRTPPIGGALYRCSRRGGRAGCAPIRTYTRPAYVFLKNSGVKRSRT